MKHRELRAISTDVGQYQPNVCSEAGIISWAVCHVTASGSIIHCFVLLRLDSFCLDAVLMQPILGLRVIQIKATLDFVGEKVKL